MQLYLARGFSVKSPREVAKRGLAIANKRTYSESQRENWPPGLSFGKAFGASGLGSFEEMAREASSGLTPMVGAIEVNSKSLELLAGSLYWVRRELGPEKYGYEKIDWGLVKGPEDLEAGYEFTIVPKCLNPESLRSMNTEIGILDSTRQTFVYRSFEEYCRTVEGQRRWFEF